MDDFAPVVADQPANPGAAPPAAPEAAPVNVGGNGGDGDAGLNLAAKLRAVIQPLPLPQVELLLAVLTDDAPDDDVRDAVVRFAQDLSGFSRSQFAKVVNKVCPPSFQLEPDRPFQALSRQALSRHQCWGPLRV